VEVAQDLRLELVGDHDRPPSRVVGRAIPADALVAGTSAAKEVAAGEAADGAATERAAWRRCDTDGVCHSEGSVDQMHATRLERGSAGSLGNEDMRLLRWDAPGGFQGVRAEAGLDGWFWWTRVRHRFGEPSVSAVCGPQASAVLGLSASVRASAVASLLVTLVDPPSPLPARHRTTCRAVGLATVAAGADPNEASAPPTAVDPVRPTKPTTLPRRGWTARRIPVTCPGATWLREPAGPGASELQLRGPTRRARAC
jgi:hypothetical protein